MKRALALVLMVTLLLSAAPLTASAAQSDAEAISALDALYTQYLNRHEFLSMYSDMEDGSQVEFLAVTDAPDSILTSCELVLPEALAVAKNNKQRGELFLQLFGAGKAITESVPDMYVVNTDEIENVYDSKVNMRLLPEKWWKTFTDGDRSLCVGPVTMLDQKGQVIDDMFYALCASFEPDETRIWLVADIDLVCNFFAISGIPTDNAQLSDAFREWMTALDGYSAPLSDEGKTLPSALTALESATMDELNQMEASIPARGPIRVAYGNAHTRVWLSTLDVIGTVKITNGSAINVRADDNTDSDIIGKAASGHTFDCIAVTDSGWYQIIFGSATGFVSQKMSEFTAQ